MDRFSRGIRRQNLMEDKLIVCIAGGNCASVVNMCLQSVKDADKIYFLYDTTSKDDTKQILDFVQKEFLEDKLVIWERPYDDEIFSNINSNSDCRNFYLEKIKEIYKGKKVFCLVLDADEVIDDFGKLRNWVDRFYDTDIGDKFLMSPRMRHFIGDLGHEDATRPVHTVLNRFFMVSDNLFYPTGEHTILNSKNTNCKSIPLNNILIWHLGYIPNLDYIKRRYINHLTKSPIHSRQFLDDWYKKLIFGVYPRREVYPMELPDIILKHFLIDKDEIYFNTHCELNIGHFFCVKAWLDYFNAKNILDLGCGVGLYGTVAKYLNVPYQGMELSKWAVEKNPGNVNMKQGDITEKQNFKDYDLVLIVDVLEHLDEKDLDKTLSYVKEYGKNFIFSIPYVGDPNLNADITHKIKQEKKWWVEQLSKYFKITDAPKEWMYAHQMLVGVPK